MAVTRSWEQRVIVQVGPFEKRAPEERRRELPWLVGASMFVCAGLAMVLFAKTGNFSELSSQLDRGEMLNLNAVTKPAQLLPFLQIFSDPTERELVAERITNYIRTRGPLPNVGALARLRVGRREIESEPRWHMLRDQLQQQLAAQQTKPRKGEIRLALIPLAKLKPVLVVRTPREYRLAFAGWAGLYLLSFYAVHFLWRRRGFRGDPGILPALHVLTGFGLILR